MPAASEYETITVQVPRQSVAAFRRGLEPLLQRHGARCVPPSDPPAPELRQLLQRGDGRPDATLVDLLVGADIETIDDLCSRTESDIKAIPQIGWVRLHQIKWALYHLDPPRVLSGEDVTAVPEYLRFLTAFNPTTYRALREQRIHSLAAISAMTLPEVLELEDPQVPRLGMVVWHGAQAGHYQLTPSKLDRSLEDGFELSAPLIEWLRLAGITVVHQLIAYTAPGLKAALEAAQRECFRGDITGVVRDIVIYEPAVAVRVIRVMLKSHGYQLSDTSTTQ